MKDWRGIPHKILSPMIPMISNVKQKYKTLNGYGSVCIPQFFTYRGTYTNSYIKHEHVGVSSLSKKRFFEGLLEKRANTTKSLVNLYLNRANLHGFCTSIRRDI